MRSARFNRHCRDDSSLMTVPSWTSCCRTPASLTCTSKTSVRHTCATPSRTRWTPLPLDRASSQKASHSGWRVEGAAELKSSRCGTTVVRRRTALPLCLPYRKPGPLHGSLGLAGTVRVRPIALPQPGHRCFGNQVVPTHTGDTDFQGGSCRDGGLN